MPYGVGALLLVGIIAIAMSVGEEPSTGTRDPDVIAQGGVLFAANCACVTAQISEVLPPAHPSSMSSTHPIITQTRPSSGPRLSGFNRTTGTSDLWHR